MVKQKLKALLKYLFLIVPFIVNSGLELIILHDKEIETWGFNTRAIKKPKIDKEKFDKMMRRITK